jgi:hypothetical protein
MASPPKELMDVIENYDERAWSLLDKLTKELDAKSPPPMIYHYTNDVGLHGILASGKLWLTDIFDLNDPSELKHGFSFAVDALSKRSASAADDIRRFARNFQFFNTSGGIEEAGHYFVCCFSADGDELGQWRAYGDNGCGFALGFEAKELEQAFIKPDGSNALSQTFSMVYDDNRSQGIQEQFAEWVFPAIDLSTSAPSMHPVGKNMYWKELSVRHAANAVSAVVFFKHEAYKNEKEYRFLQLFSRDKSVPLIKYRTRPHSLVRYREFDWRALAPSSLKRIVAGPASERHKAHQFVKDCLQAYDQRADQIEIGRSKIPYRIA